MCMRVYVYVKKNGGYLNTFKPIHSKIMHILSLSLSHTHTHVHINEIVGINSFLLKIFLPSRKRERERGKEKKSEK